MWLAFIKALFELKKYFMRAGPQLGVDAYASVAAFGHESLQAASRDTLLHTFAKAARALPAPSPSLANAFILTITNFFLNQHIFPTIP